MKRNRKKTWIDDHTGSHVIMKQAWCLFIQHLNTENSMKNNNNVIVCAHQNDTRKEENREDQRMKQTEVVITSLPSLFLSLPGLCYAQTIEVTGDSFRPHSFEP